MIPVRYISACLDGSGYANAARNYIRALLTTKEVDLSLTITSFEQQKTSHGDFKELISPYVDKPLDTKIQIVHLTPENFPTFINKNCYNVGYTVWETDKLPDQWVSLINLMDEIWTASEWNVQVFKKSGIIKPIYCIPHCFNFPNIENVSPMPIGDLDTYVFYYIAQWIQRKGPLEILKAYLTEFLPNENVLLALKTYRLNFGPQEIDSIRKQISAIKQSLNLSEFPKIAFFPNLMTGDEILSLHKRGNCFVLPTRGEAFGIPFAESLAFGKPVIGSNYGGNLDFMNKNNSYLIPCRAAPVSGMIFGNYHGHMNWADPCVYSLKKIMRHVFNHKEEAIAKAKIGQKYIQEVLSYENIGRLMFNRLKEIKERT